MNPNSRFVHWKFDNSQAIRVALIKAGDIEGSLGGSAMPEYTGYRETHI